MKKEEVIPFAREAFDKHRGWFESYPRAYAAACKTSTDKSFDPAKDEMTDVKRVIDWFQYFWENLPDHAGIRKGGFFACCDIAENIFNEDVYPQEE